MQPSPCQRSTALSTSQWRTQPASERAMHHCSYEPSSLVSKARHDLKSGTWRYAGGKLPLSPPSIMSHGCTVLLIALNAVAGAPLVAGVHAGDQRIGDRLPACVFLLVVAACSHPHVSARQHCPRVSGAPRRHLSGHAPLLVRTILAGLESEARLEVRH